MCDTMVALGNSTKDGSVIFAKNSDRQPNEPLIPIRIPRRKHPQGAKVRCTYIEIDQAEETFEVLLLKPSWMWGGEMGCNEFGLNIGNEAVFTRERYGKEEKLLGMDMLRLALERCKTSAEALNLLVFLLQRYGQGGNCGYEKPFTYHNSFLIADKKTAWVLETAGEYWAAEEVKDLRSISNRLSIGSRYDRGHPDLVQHAVDKKWCRGEADFHFARCYGDPMVTRFSGSENRQCSAQDRLLKEKGQIDCWTMKNILRSHDRLAEGKQFTRHSLKSVCMHGGFIFGDHTTGSYIASLSENRCTYRITGSSTPCLAMFKPYWMIENEKFSYAEDEAEAAVQLWRKREMLHRFVLENRIPDLSAYLAKRDSLESEFEQMISDSEGAGENQLRQIMDYALNEEEKLLEKTLKPVPETNQHGKIRGSLYFKHYWRKQNAALDKPRRFNKDHS